MNEAKIIETDTGKVALAGKHGAWVEREAASPREACAGDPHHRWWRTGAPWPLS